MAHRQQIEVQISGLAEYLISDGLLTLSKAQHALSAAKLMKMHFITYIVTNKIVNSHDILNCCVKTLGLPIYDLNNYNIEWLDNLPDSTDLVHRYHFIPLYKHHDILHIGLSDPIDTATLETLTFHIGSRLQIVLVSEDLLSQLLAKYFNHSSIELSLINRISPETTLNVIQENSVQYDEPLIRFVDNIIQHAIHQLASDIHIEPYESICRIRYRQDGLLCEAADIPTELAGRVTARLKVLAKLDIAERRLPQDGRIQLFNRDIRINTCPTLFGEKIVLRLLNPNTMMHHLENLGLIENQLSLIKSKISQAQGMILVTGPTGSGKTVTLYSILHFLNSVEKNISTVEDPIEIQLAGINQVNVHPKIGLTFSNILKTLLRQDPDILMVGEIRDLETAEIAMQAAQTGHLVLSTLHTNSAIDTIIRLKSMGIPAYITASTISLIIAQRLIRKLCDHCKQIETLSDDILASLELSHDTNNITFHKAIGCHHCLHGYRGRTGIYEILPISDQLSELILSQASSVKIHEIIRHQSFISLKESAFHKVKLGMTSLMEMKRVLQA